MDTVERREKLIAQIKLMNDSELDQLEAALENEIAISEALERSAQQIKEGKLTPHSQVRQRYQKWL